MQYVVNIAVTYTANNAESKIHADKMLIIS